jgi:hypothetical protein
VHSHGAYSTGDANLDLALADRYLVGGPNDSSIRQWWSWGGLESAKVYPTQREAKRAMKGYRRRRGEHIDIVNIEDE